MLPTTNATKDIFEQLNEFKKKYYVNLLLKGLLLSVAIIVSVFIIINFAEYFGRFSRLIRGLLLFSFVAAAAAVVFAFVIRPIFYLLKINQPLSDVEAAKEIGRLFPEIDDKLLNVIQLSALTSADSSLIQASIDQKSNSLRLVKFSDAIRFNENKKYLKYALPPLLLILLISAISPSFFSKSTERIVRFQNDFVEEAPFTFNIQNKGLIGEKNQDFVLELSLEGSAYPDEVFVFYNNRKFKMNKQAPNAYSFVFSKLSDSFDFSFNAAGFTSKEYTLEVVTPPNLLSFDILLTYPAYLAKQPEKLSNVGNLIVPEGTRIKWEFYTSNTDSVFVRFDQQPRMFVIPPVSGTNFSFAKTIAKSTLYEVFLKNRRTLSDSDINYYINTIHDKFPTLDLVQLKDSTLYSSIQFGGTIGDDYGLTKFKFFYKKGNSESYQSTDIPYNATQTSQRFYYQFDLNALNLNRGDKLTYFLQLWDNDGVNGSKSTKSGVFTFEVPSTIDYSQEIDKQVKQTEDKMENILKKSKELKKSIDKLDKKLKVEEKIGFQEKKELEDILKQKEELQKEIEKLVQEFIKLQEKQERFNEFSPQTKEKMEQLQKLMNDLMNQENKELFKQLEELLNKEEDPSKQLEEIKKNERNLDRNINRTLKLFKNLQLKQKVEDVVKDLEKLADKQEELAKETEQKKDEDSKDLKEKQNKLNKEFKDQKKKLDEVEKLSKELDKDIDTNDNEQDQVEQNQEKAAEELDKDQPSNSSKSQKKAAKSMRNIAKSMSSQMQSAEMKQLDLDIDALRDILENVVKLSFDQERVMKEIRGLNSSDPRFVELSQEQLKLVDDAKVIEDSLYSLAKKVMQIESFVTNEVTNMNNYMQSSLQELKDRKLPAASAKQQFSMTSINNLALLLSDTFKQMQQMMMAMSMPGGSGKGKKGEMPSPGLGEKQKGINNRIDKLGKDGKQGRQLSEELGKLAQEQSQLRKELQKMQDQLNGTKEGEKLGKQLSELQKEMDKTEEDLVNKRIGDNLKRRNKEIETRLLEAEKALKEQELDPKRKSNSGAIINANPPKELEKLINEKSKQNELLKFTPPNYTPFYKNQTDNYFKRIK